MNLFPSFSEESACSPNQPRAARNRRALGILAVVAVGAVLFGGPVRRHSLSVLALRSDAPSDAVLEEIAGTDGHSESALERIWRSGNTSGRLFVMNRLNRSLASELALVQKLAPLVQEAVCDIDPEVRELAFNLLTSQKHPALRSILHEQLADADPAIRVLGLQHLLPIANSNDVAVAARLLADADPRVVVCAGTLLRRVTGQDFGLRMTQALPRFVPIGDAPLPLPDWDSIRQGRDGWREWWRRHHTEFPTGAVALRHDHSARRRPMTDFALEDTRGKTVRLSDLRGKTVLLTFWHPAKEASFADEATLKTLAQTRTDRFAVLAIASDPAVWKQDDCGDHSSGGHDPEHGGGHAHGPAAKSKLSPDQSKADARAAAARLSVNHPVLLDPKASMASRFNVHGFPSYVLLDAQGNVVRRFTGSRTAEVFTAMLDEAEASNRPQTTSLP